MRSFLNDFKKFILRGNVLDLAVAVVVGTAFNAVVQSFANDIVIGFIGGDLRPAELRRRHRSTSATGGSRSGSSSPRSSTS